MKQNKFILFAVVGLSLGLSSCVDNQYDLSDIDMTLGVNSDLTLPTSSVGDILLKNVLNLEEDGIVKLVPNPVIPGQEMYVVKQSGVADIKPMKIDEVKIVAPKVGDFYSEISLKNLAQRGSAVRRSATRAGSPTIQDETFRYEIGVGQAMQEIEKTTASNVSTDVVSIENVKFDEVVVTLRLQVKGFPSHINKMHIDGMTLTFPEDFHVTSCLFNGVAAKTIGNGTIDVTAAVDEARDISTPQILKITIDRANAVKDFTFDESRHEVALCGEFKVGGIFRVETSEMDKDQLTEMVNKYIQTHPDAQNVSLLDVPGAIPETVTFTGTTKFENDILLTHVSGTFKHEVGDVEPVTLDDLPDFLDDENVVLDLDNPMVFLRIKNSLPADLNTNITLSSETDQNRPHSTGSMTIGADRDNLYYLASKQENKYLPEEQSAAEWLKVDGLSNVIKRIPKKVNINISTVTLKAQDLDIRKEYPIDATYDVYAPLVFGPDFYLTYNDTDRDWDVGEDIGKLNADAITATATITSNLPADMTLVIDLIDNEGKKIDTVEDIAVSCSANANEEPINVVIKAKSGHQLREILSGKDANGRACQKLDGMRYRAVLAKPVEGQVLDGNGKILIKNVKVSLKGVVTYDAN